MARPDLLMIGSWPKWDMDALEPEYVVHRLWEAPEQDVFLAEIGSSVRAIGTRGDLTVPAALMAKLPKLEVIACNGVGVDGIDLAAAKARGVKVTNTPGVLCEEVADVALYLMLGISRLVPQGDQFVRSGKWAKAAFPLATRMYDKRLGLIGIGGIGSAIARRAAAFGMPISYHARRQRPELGYRYFSSAEELAANCDFLVAACTGGAATAKLVNAKVLKALGPNGYFINVARGTVADEPALLDALESRQIAGAGLDVFINEPNIDQRFFKLENVVLQPHVGSGTLETRKAMGQLTRDNLAAHFAGKPLLTEVV
jgi:lactate dehydrogenase-like 2-hydroxyacid dehydrogenase